MMNTVPDAKTFLTYLEVAFQQVWQMNANKSAVMMCNTSETLSALTRDLTQQVMSDLMVLLHWEGTVSEYLRLGQQLSNLTKSGISHS